MMVANSTAKHKLASSHMRLCTSKAARHLMQINDWNIFPQIAKL